LTDTPDPSFIPTNKEEAMDLLTNVWGDSSKLTKEQQEAIRPFFLPEEYLSPVKKEEGAIDLIHAGGDEDVRW